MRRSRIISVAAIIALIAAHCFTAVATPHAWETSLTSGSGHHLTAVRAIASPRIAAARIKGAPDRFQTGKSPCDASARVLAFASTRSAGADPAPRLAVGLVRESPAACRPPPRA